MAIPIKHLRFEGRDLTGEIRGKRYRVGFVVDVEKGHHYIETHPYVNISVEIWESNVQRIRFEAEHVPNRRYRTVREWVEESKGGRNDNQK